MQRNADMNLYKKIVLQVVLLLMLYQVSRLLFFVINHHYFNEIQVFNYLKFVFYGLRFDLSAIFSINFLYLFLALIPLSIHNKIWYQRILNYLFILSNSIAFLFDLSDIGYFPYVRKRMTAEVFHLIGNKSDFIDLLPSYLQEFWYIPIISIVFISFFIYFNRLILRKCISEKQNQFSFKTVLIYVFILGISVIAIRGGLQLKPIMNINALLAVSNENTSLVLNTPFSILHTLEQKKLERLDFFTEEEIKREFNPIKNYSKGTNSTQKNIVFIILESFGKQYTSLGGRKSVTPFLDSLMMKSIVFSNAYANGHRSADGIPACLAGIPIFMEESFTTSPYSSNSLETLPLLLKKIGYSSSFFHGGTNGTMNFDIFAKSAGFDQYFGRTEYGNDKDYDGTWGIWDEPFLQFYANEVDKLKQPFFTSVFTLSSHEPFKIPAQYQDTSFAKLKGIYKGISYSDHALKKYFETVSSKKWFSNTLFVITADHNFLANNDSLGFYNNGLGLYSIPVILYDPSSENQNFISTKSFQQIDILPTVLDYLKYPHPFFAYGNSGFDTIKNNFVYTQMGDHHQFLYHDYLLVTDNYSLSGCYDFRKDSLLQYPIQNDSLIHSMMFSFKTFKQILQNTIIDNKQTSSSFNNRN